MGGIFENYKSRVSIARAAETIGYVIRADKGKGRSITMGILDGKNKWSSQIVVVNHNVVGADYYFSRDEDSRNKGDLISFINFHMADFRSRFGLTSTRIKPDDYDIEGIKAVLECLTGMTFDKEIRSVTGERTGRTDLVFRIEDYEVRQLDDNGRNFLIDGRNLSPSTVDLFRPFIRSVAYTGRGRRFFNVAFPYRVPGQEAVCNFEMRNYKYKGHCAGGNKQDAAWVVQFSNEPWDVEFVYMFESAIDAMSFYELNSAILVSRLPNVAFVSFGGSLTRAQILVLKRHFEAARFVCCFDNDESGVRYDITTACALGDITLQRSIRNGIVEFICNGRNFSIPNDSLTFTAWVKASGIRQNVLVKKPRFTDKSLYEDGTTETVWFKDWNDCLKFRKTPKKEYVLYRGNMRSFNNV